MPYANTNEKLYDDIALWEKTDGKDLFLQMPLKEKQSPKILDFGYGFGEQLFALANAYPKGKIFGIDGSPYCQKEVAEKITQRKISNITLINKMVNDLSDFADDSMDLVLLYDALHATSNKYMLYEESHRILKTGGVLSNNILFKFISENFIFEKYSSFFISSVILFLSFCSILSLFSLIFDSNFLFFCISVANKGEYNEDKIKELINIY